MKLEKLAILVHLVTERNLDPVLTELCDYSRVCAWTAIRQS